jgi:hypothetical protein
MQERSTSLAIHLAVGPDAAAAEVADETSRLRQELLDLDVDAMEMPSGEQRRLTGERLRRHGSL